MPSTMFIRSPISLFHGLVGEGGEEIDLPLAEWLDDRAGEKHYADRAALAQQGHADYGAEAAEPLSIKMDEFRIGEDIGDMRRLGRADQSPTFPNAHPTE